MKFLADAGRASKTFALAAGVQAALLLGTAPSFAAAGHPEPGEMGMQEAVTQVARDIHSLYYDILTPIIFIISLFVLGLILWVIYRFNEKKNPTPSRTTHNVILEVAWTVVPVMILVVIAIPSFRLLTKQLTLPDADVTVKVTGKQWYWTYDYPPDQGGGFEFDSYMKPEDQLKPGEMRQLAVDNEAVVPVGKTIRVQVTAADVIHSFTIPSFGIRIDAVPGRLNETWFKAEREGLYYGQCSKLCGENHAYMPIAFRVVSEQQYAEWLADAKKKFASSSDKPVHFADNDAPVSTQQ
jgi:cytochrome c oxidase subunit II